MLIRIVDFVDGINERTKDGDVSVQDASQGVLDGMTWDELTRLRGSAIELQQRIERELLGRNNRGE